jgi:hypothetical protein
MTATILLIGLVVRTVLPPVIPLSMYLIAAIALRRLLPFTAMAEQGQPEHLDARVAGLRDQLKLLADYL